MCSVWLITHKENTDLVKGSPIKTKEIHWYFVRSSHSGEYEICSLLGCGAV